MGYGPVAFSTSQSVDESAPGAPMFVSIEQPGNQNDSFTCKIRLPDADANGTTPPSGLKKLAVATTTKDGDTNPYEGKSMEEILAMGPESPSVVTDLDPTANPPGSEVDVKLPITLLGSSQEFAAACAD